MVKPVIRTFRRPLYRFLDKNGDGTGETDASEDYSDTGLGLTEFYITPMADEVMRIERIIPFLQDTGPLDADFYGHDITLTEGVNLQICRGPLGAGREVVVDLMDGQAVLTNAGWGKLCYDVDISEFGREDNVLHARWSFFKAGQPLQLDGAKGERLSIILNDDLSDLVSHAFMVQGRSLTHDYEGELIR